MATPLNFLHLYHFWVIAQEGSLLAASRRLGVRHSTLSAQMRALEESLGARLLMRRPRGMRLTAQAEVMRAYCDQIFRLSAELAEAATGERAGRMRVGTLPAVPRSLLYEALRPALERESNVRVELTVSDLDLACRNLVTGRLHVVVSDRLPAGPAAAQVHAHLVGETRVALYATARLAERHRTGFPHSLDGAPMLLPAAGAPLREGLATWFAEEGFRPRIVGEFDDVPTMKGFAARGHGIVPVRLALALEARQRYGLLLIGHVPGLADRLYALTLGRRVRHPGVQRLIDECRGRLGRKARRA